MGRHFVPRRHLHFLAIAKLGCSVIVARIRRGGGDKRYQQGRGGSQRQVSRIRGESVLQWISSSLGLSGSMCVTMRARYLIASK